MIEKLLDAAIRFRWGVVVITVIIAAFGAATRFCCYFTTLPTPRPRGSEAVSSWVPFTRMAPPAMPSNVASTTWLISR